MHRKKGIYLVLGLCFWAGMAGAEFYQYRDEAGRTVFTDDLSRLPEKEREKVKRFRSVDTETEAEKAETAVVSPEEEAEAQHPEVPSLEEEAVRIEAERKALAEEFVRLQAVQKKLTERVPGLARADAETVTAHNREVAAFDASREAYEKRRARYNTDVQAFNTRVQEKEKTAREKGGDQQGEEGQAP